MAKKAIYVLEATEEGLKQMKPEETTKGFVIRAFSEESARGMAGSYSRGEGSAFWENPALASCEEVTTKGDEAVILQADQD